jgi:hypothetical protein
MNCSELSIISGECHEIRDETIQKRNCDCRAAAESYNGLGLMKCRKIPDQRETVNDLLSEIAMKSRIFFHPGTAWGCR